MAAAAPTPDTPAPEQLYIPSGTLTILDGSICVGKSTMLRTLKLYARVDSRGNPVIYYDEQVDLGVIEEYKRRLRSSSNKTDIMRFAMDLQVKIMHAREKVIQSACQLVSEGRTVIIERGTLGNLVFALNAWSKFYDQPEMMIEFARYMLLMASELTKRAALGPHKIYTLYLRTDIEEVIKRNKLRDTEAYAPEYLRNLQNLYEITPAVYPPNELIVFDTKKVADVLGYETSEAMIECISTDKLLPVIRDESLPAPRTSAQEAREEKLQPGIAIVETCTVFKRNVYDYVLAELRKAYVLSAAQ